MVLRFIDNLIKHISLDLEVLQKDANNYSMLLFQHKGTFSTHGDKFGNSTDCSVKFTEFIELAKLENVSLALTPEYSCPWNSIIDIIQDDTKWPNNSKLWVVCCESIKPEEIKTFQKTNTSDNVLIYFDEGVLNQGGGVLLDPLCYIFRANVGDVEKLVVLVQFKTQHMGVWTTPIERDKYIPGKELYVLRNSVSSIYLFTCICSEVEMFSITEQFKNQLDNRWDENPYIILNPQMNPKPENRIFKLFRKKILKYPNKDVISLNWGGETLFSGSTDPYIVLSKSSIIFETADIKYDDDKLFTANHKKGLYYLNRKSNEHGYYLNPFVEVFEILHQKPSSAGVEKAMVRRTGPEVKKLFIWNINENIFVERDETDDGFVNFLQSLNCNNQALQNSAISFIDKERLVNISCGKVCAKGDDKRWYRIDRLESFVQDEDENVKRLTYVYDESSKETRKKYIELMESLNDIVSHNLEFPNNIRYFKGNCTEIMFNIDGCNPCDYKYNLVTNDKKGLATVAYIGRDDNATAQKVFAQLQSIFDRDDQAKKKIVVWYKENASEIKSIYDSSPPGISDDSNIDQNSIVKVQDE
jgi:hypothetical protein